MTRHDMKLNPVPLAMISNGTKTIEARLFDEKRQLVQLGDEIVFTSTEDAAHGVATRVIGLLRYETFAAMYYHNDPIKFGGEDPAVLTEQIRAYYGFGGERRYGVLGIELEVISGSAPQM